MNLLCLRKWAGIIELVFWLIPFHCLNAQHLTLQQTFERKGNNGSWSLMLYGGMSQDRNLAEVLTFRYRVGQESLVAMELMYTVSPLNPVAKWLSPFIHHIQTAFIFALRKAPGDKIVLEWDPYFMVRWSRFPWSPWVLTTFAVGEGFSITSRVPRQEMNDPKTSRFLNFLMFEATLGLPQLPQLELVGRIHHRSGVYGLYGAGDSGSNVVGLGIRYHFA